MIQTSVDRDISVTVSITGSPDEFEAMLAHMTAPEFVKEHYLVDDKMQCEPSSYAHPYRRLCQILSLAMNKPNDQIHL